MPSKKSTKETNQPKKDRQVEETEQDFLEEDDEEEEVEYELADDAEAKLDNALEILGSPAIIHQGLTPDYDPYPTDSHRKNNVKYTPGDKVLPFNDTLILR